jgi:aminoglycoside phosphotransferase (APT) family kinase protein
VSKDLPTNAYARLIDELAPGGRLVSMRRLRGGIGARMHVLDIERADGARFKVSLRRFVRQHPFSEPAHVSHEYRILQFLEEAGVAAPRPLLLDAEGRLFGVPALVLTFTPGQPLLVPRDTQSWVRQVVEALLQIHSITPQHFDLSWLGVNLRQGMQEEIDRRREHVAEWAPLLREVHATLDREIDRIDWPEPTFVHDDYWPGNTVWRRGRLVAVIDWTASELGDPRADVAECRLNIALSLSMDVAGAFLDTYQSAAATPLPDVWYFDLFRGLRALLYYERWLKGYHDAGLSHITPALARRRIEAFVRRALREAEHPRR